jgi:hypothetical protein
LIEWTNGSGPAERLSAQVLIHEGFEGLDPSHPLGGPDGGKDAVCWKNGKKWIMAVYFPRGQQDIGTIRSKFAMDFRGVERNTASGFVFVTNQELRLAERAELCTSTGSVDTELYHLERITMVLDVPAMASVRHQFLGIESDGRAAILYEKRLAAADNLWATWTEFCDRAPIWFLDCVTYEEEKSLNMYPKVFDELQAKLTNRWVVEWMDFTKGVERDRHLIGEDLWSLFFAARAIIARIVFVLQREVESAPLGQMMPWRDDPPTNELLRRVFTEEQVVEILGGYSAMQLIRQILDQRLLRGIDALRNAP